MKGLFPGLRLGLVYWCVEVFFSIVMPRLMTPAYLYSPLHQGFTLLLLLLYPAIGALLGVAVAAVLRRLIHSKVISFRRDTLLSSLLRAVVLLLIVAHLTLAQGLRAMPSGLLLTGLLLLSLPLVRVARRGPRSPVALLAASPWTLFGSVLGSIWLCEEVLYNSNWTVQFLGMLGVFGAALAASATAFAISRLSAVQRFGPGAQRLQAPAAVMVALSCCLIIDQAPFVSSSTSPTAAAPAGAPNVILITLDTLRADHMSIYGYRHQTTPYLEKLCQEATLFENAVSSGTFTLPTHASLFTGLYPSWHGAHYSPPDFPDGRPLDPSYLTLAEILSASGYQTVGVAANRGFLSHSFGLDQGFQIYDNRAPVQFLTRTRTYFLRQSIRDLLTRFTVSANFDRDARSAEAINQVVFERLEELQKQEKPFFLFINYMDAHWPYIPPAPFDTLFPGKADRFTMEDSLNLVGDVLAFERPLADWERAHLLSQYDGSIRYLDSRIAQLLEKLRNRNLYRESLIIITSDHGEAFGERNLMEHGVSVYQDQVHVPLIIKYPKQRKGETVKDFVNSVDILPTVLEVAKLETPPLIQGASLLRKDTWKSRPVISEVYPRGFLRYWNPRLNRIQRAIYADGFKYIRSTAGEREIYDLGSDPLETTNLTTQLPEATVQLEAAIQHWFSSLSGVSRKGPELDKATLDRLKALGYIR